MRTGRRSAAGPVCRGTEDWVLMARMASTALEVEAAIIAEALEKRRIGDVAASRERAGRILAEAEAAVARARVDDDGTGRGEPDASVATARAFHARLQGRDDAAAWAELAGRWRDLGDPYREARARWHQAEAILGAATAGVVGSRGRTDARVVRADAREPLGSAVELAMSNTWRRRPAALVPFVLVSTVGVATEGSGATTARDPDQLTESRRPVIL